MSYAEQITAKEQELVAKRDTVTALVKDVDEGVDGSVDALDAANAERSAYLLLPLLITSS